MFIADIFLSRIFIFLVITMMMLSVTWWSVLRNREYPGYGLGWLIGIFFIIVYSAVTGDSTAGEAAEDETLPLLAVCFPSIFGVIAGGGLLLFMRVVGQSNVRRALTVAALTALFVALMFLVVVSSQNVSQMIGIFAIAFAIGALLMIILGGMSSSSGSGGQPNGGDDLRSRYSNLRNR